jgi:hypothetical protein
MYSELSCGGADFDVREVLIAVLRKAEVDGGVE